MCSRIISQSSGGLQEQKTSNLETKLNLRMGPDQGVFAWKLALDY